MSDFDELNLGPRWYVIHTYSGYENKVKATIEKIVENRGLGHLIYDLQIPVETTLVTNEKGVQKTVESKLLPSYVLIKMTMTDESWHAVRTVSGVTGFVGPGSKPVPLTEEEVEGFLGAAVKEEFGFKVGDKVKVVSGTFAGYSGTLQEIAEDQKQVTVLASTGRRDIPIVVDARDIALAND